MVKYWYPDGEIMVSWSDWYPQSNSPALSFTRAAPTSGKTWLESWIKLHQTCVLFSWRFTKTEQIVFFHFVFLRCWSLEVACNPQSSESWRQIVPIYYNQPTNHHKTNFVSNKIIFCSSCVFISTNFTNFTHPKIHPSRPLIVILLHCQFR